MAATATSFGDGDWGIDTAETGFIIESVSHSFSNKNKPVMNRTGNTSGITYYDETVKVSLKGKLPSSSPFATTLAAALTLGNALESYLKGGATSGLNIVESITVDLANEDYKSISVEATNYPNITA